MTIQIDLTGKVALVTGASQGIGFACAEVLARSGADVAIVARRPDVLDRAKEKIVAETNAQVIAIPGDVAKPSFPVKAVSEVRQELGTVDILVNNAGGPPPGPFMDMTLEDWHGALAQNLLSVVLFSQAVVPEMKDKGWGRIINIASTSIKEPMPGMVLSNATRAAVAAVAKTMSLEFSEFGITINTICPGPTYTDRAEFLIKRRCEKDALTEEEVIRKIASNVPVGRMAQPEEIAALIGFIASDLSGYITGAVLAVDGGLTRSLY